MDILKIVASLKYGKFFNRKIVAFLYFALATGLLMLLFGIIMAILIFVVKELTWNKETILIIVFFCSFGLLLGGTALWVVIKNDKHKKEIVLYLNDAIVLKALVKRLDIVSLEYKPYQVQVEFEIDGKKVYKISAPGTFWGGYHKIFAKYDNKKIDILYSPKYDQVLILKDNMD